MPPTPEPKQRINLLTAICMIGVAVGVDGLQAVLEFILGATVILGAAGVVVGWFFAVLGFIIFGLWFALVGVSYFGRNGAVKVVLCLASCVVELIPYLDMIPALTFGVVSLILITRAEDGKTPFLFNLAARRQAGMSNEELAGAQARAQALQQRDAASNASLMVRGSSAPRPQDYRYRGVQTSPEEP